MKPHCCPCGETHGPNGSAFTRRDFLKSTGVAALGSVAAGGLAWPLLAARPETAEAVWRPAPLRVKPLLVHDLPKRRPQTSWRSWGGLETEADARAEVARIQGELDALTKKAEFPLEFLPVSAIRRAADLPGVKDMGDAQAFIVYAAGGWMDVFDALDKTGKDRIYFCRHKSGPVYLWYEIISPRYLRQHTDSLAVKGVAEGDVVIDSQDELLWRLRALAGLRNTMGTKILAVGGPAAWADPEGPGAVVKRVIDTWNFDIVNVPYDDLGRLIREARADAATVRRAKARADAYLRTPGTSLETDRPFVENGLLLDEVFAWLADSPVGSWTSHLGHGIGLFPHEAPHLNPAWDDVLQEGEVIAVEPALYDPVLRTGLRLENDYLVTADGLELLSPFPLDLA